MGYAERVPLGTPYPRLVEQVVALLAALPFRPETTALVVDQTGVGAPVCDPFTQASVPFVGVTITAGQTVTVLGPDRLGVPKRDLVSIMAVLLEQRRLQFAVDATTTTRLRRELEAFRRTVTPVGHDAYASWREQDHGGRRGAQPLRAATGCGAGRPRGARLAEVNAALAPEKQRLQRQWLVDHPDRTATDFDRLAWPLLRQNLLEERRAQRVEQTVAQLRRSGRYTL